MSRIIPDATRERLREIDWLYPHFADSDGRMRGAIHALIVDTPSHTIIVDTCIGNDKARPNRPSGHMKTDNTYLSNLNDLYRPWIMKSGHPYLIIDTEEVDFRTDEGLDQVIEGIIEKVPGTKALFA